MKNFELKIAITVIICAALTLIFSCNKTKTESPVEEIQTAKAPSTKCYTVCNVNKNPDLQIVTNANDPNINSQVDGIIDSSTYFWTRYKVRTEPVRLTQNFLTPALYNTLYGWDSGVVVNRVRLQCLVENISPFDTTCVNDWEYNESDGYVVDFRYFFDGLFQFDTYEKGNGNNWRFLYNDFKKEFFPSYDPVYEYRLNTNFCEYYSPQRGLPAQSGDFYFNPFRLPNHDGVYKIVLKFNPQIKGCRAVKETDYSNNEKTIELQIINGTVLIIKN